MPQQQYDESIFNMALAYLKRIDKLLSMCSAHAMDGDIEKWLHALMGVYREMSVKLNATEKELIIGKDDDNIIDVGNLSAKDATLNKINYLVNTPKHKIKLRKQILFLLHHSEIKIRTKMQEKGMLLPTKDDPRRAILDM